MSNSAIPVPPVRDIYARADSYGFVMKLRYADEIVVLTYGRDRGHAHYRTYEQFCNMILNLSDDHTEVVVKLGRDDHTFSAAELRAYLIELDAYRATMDRIHLDLEIEAALSGGTGSDANSGAGDVLAAEFEAYLGGR